MKFYTIILLTFATITLMKAQSLSAPLLQVGYYGNVLFHPGIKVAYEKPVSLWEKQGKRTTRQKSLAIGGDLIYYYSADHHHALMVGPSASFKRTRENGKFLQCKVGLGLHRSFVDGITYVALEDGDFSVGSLIGQNTFYQSLTFGFGKQLNDRMGYFAEFGLNGRFPYNHSYLSGVHVGVGIQFSLKKTK